MRAVIILCALISTAALSYLAWAQYEARASAQMAAAAAAEERRYQQALAGCKDTRAPPEQRDFACTALEAMTYDRIDRLRGNPPGTAAKARRDEAAQKAQRELEEAERKANVAKRDMQSAISRIEEQEARIKADRQAGQTPEERKAAEDLKEAF